MERLPKNKLKELPGALLPWYNTNARDLPWRKSKAPYLVWLSEIMLQQTRVEAVKGYYTRFLQALPTIEDLAKVPDDVLLKLWEGLGYYNRAKNLKRGAQEVLTRFGGTFPCTYEEVLSLPGIGEYTAGAICSICFGLSTPAVDGNVLRVMTRLFALSTPIHTPALKKEITAQLAAVYPKDHACEFTQALMELGATVCVPNGAPHCELCPLASLCMARKHNTQHCFPVKAGKKPRKKEQRTVLILSCGNLYAVNKRPKEGLLGGLFEFPNTPGTLTKEEAVSYLKERCITPKDILLTANRKHIFTHIEWDMKGMYFSVENTSDAFLWVTKEQLSEEVALPTAFKQFCKLIF